MINPHTSTRILVSPLNWGLGHASRCIPIINKLIQLGFEVHIASDGLALKLLKSEFEDAIFHELLSYNISYSSKKNQKAKLITTMPSVLKTIRAERKLMADLHLQYNFSGLISDNRPGAFLDNCPSVYITHQTVVNAGLFSVVASYLHQKIYAKYSQVWIPDDAEVRLAGLLSEKVPHSQYIGWLSRAKKVYDFEYFDVLVLLSGPEPQRTLLENKVIDQLSVLELKVLLVRGTQIPLEREKPVNFTVVDLATSKELDYWVAQSKIVVARTGYTTLMDLLVWKKKAVLVPTPGQTEQEFLGRRLKTIYNACVKNQEVLNLETDLLEAQPILTNSQVTEPDNALFNLFQK